MLVSPFLLQVMEIKKNIRKFNGFAFDKVRLRVKLANFISDGRSKLLLRNVQGL